MKSFQLKAVAAAALLLGATAANADSLSTGGGGTLGPGGTSVSGNASANAEGARAGMGGTGINNGAGTAAMTGSSTSATAGAVDATRGGAYSGRYDPAAPNRPNDPGMENTTADPSLPAKLSNPTDMTATGSAASRSNANVGTRSGHATTAATSTSPRHGVNARSSTRAHRNPATTRSISGSPESAGGGVNSSGETSGSRGALR